MASEKFCPTCKNKNVSTALVCSFCGASLEEDPTNLVAVTEYVGGQAAVSDEDIAGFIDTALIPEGGVGIHVAGAPQPYYMPVYKEFVIGRRPDDTLESILDLSDLDAFNLGVSRRHVMIRRTDFGFEVIDLASRNGTWLNAQQLIPNKPYAFASGSQLRLGRMRLFIVYQVVNKSVQPK